MPNNYLVVYAMNTFDFETVAKFYQNNNLKTLTPRGYRVPTINELSSIARKLLQKAVTNNFVWSTACFKAVRVGDELKLEFIK